MQTKSFACAVPEGIVGKHTGYPSCLSTVRNT